MKSIAGRPHDIGDIGEVLPNATAPDRARVTQLLQLAPEPKRTRGLETWAIAQKLAARFEPEPLVKKVRRSKQKRP